MIVTGKLLNYAGISSMIVEVAQYETNGYLSKKRVNLACGFILMSTEMEKGDVI